MRSGHPMPLAAQPRCEPLLGILPLLAVFALPLEIRLHHICHLPGMHFCVPLVPASPRLDSLSTGVTSRVAHARMLIAALQSRSITVPQFSHSYSRSDSLSAGLIYPHEEQRLDVGSQRFVTVKSVSYISALYSNCLRNSPQPTSDIALDNFRFRIIPLTFKSSIDTAWFSRHNRVVSLCKKSVRMLAIRA